MSINQESLREQGGDESQEDLEGAKKDLPPNQYYSLEAAIAEAEKSRQEAFEREEELKDYARTDVFRLPGKDGEPDRYLVAHEDWAYQYGDNLEKVWPRPEGKEGS